MDEEYFYVSYSLCVEPDEDASFFFFQLSAINMEKLTFFPSQMHGATSNQMLNKCCSDLQNLRHISRSFSKALCIVVATQQYLNSR